MKMGLKEDFLEKWCLRLGCWSTGCQTPGSLLCSLLQAMQISGQIPAFLFQPQRFDRSIQGSWSNEQQSPWAGEGMSSHFGAWLPFSTLGRNDIIPWYARLTPKSAPCPPPKIKLPGFWERKKKLGVNQRIVLIMQLSGEIEFQAEQQQIEIVPLGN